MKFNALYTADRCTVLQPQNKYWKIKIHTTRLKSIKFYKKAFKPMFELVYQHKITLMFMTHIVAQCGLFHNVHNTHVILIFTEKYSEENNRDFFQGKQKTVI